MSNSLSHYQFEDDGMYNNQWRIYEEPRFPGDTGKAFADAWSEADAKEIFDAINAARARNKTDTD